MVRLLQTAADEKGSPVRPSIQHRPSSLRLRNTPRPAPIRSIEELIEHPERIAETPITPGFHDDLPWPDSPTTAADQDEKITTLLSKNLEIYQGHLYWDSYSKEILHLDPTLVPQPLFFDPEDHQLFVRPLSNSLRSGSGRRPASAQPCSRWDSNPGNSTTARAGDRKHDVLTWTSSKRVQDMFSDRSTDRPFKGSRIPSPVRECPELASPKPLLGPFLPQIPSETGSKLTRTPTRSPAGRSLTVSTSTLSPARRLPRSPAAESLFASPRAADGKPPATNARGGTGLERSFALPSLRPALEGTAKEPEKRSHGRTGITDFDRTRDIFESPKLRSTDVTVDFKKVNLHGLSRSRAVTPLLFPRDMLKVSFTDMACESWFRRGDIWIYCRPFGPTSTTYISKELKIRKISNEGTVALEMAEGSKHVLPQNDGLPQRVLPSIKELMGESAVDGNDLDEEAFLATEDAASTNSRSQDAISMQTARDSSKTMLRRVRDATSRSRSASAHAAGKQRPPPTQRVRTRRSTIAPNTVMIEIRLLQDLERLVKDNDIRFLRLSAHDVGSNLWKQIHIVRDDELVGSLWALRQVALEQWQQDKSESPRWHY